jgi:ornithine cyclodeaminase/alanine dehydrogenase-like protein (mu-crystallin family)
MISPALQSAVGSPVVIAVPGLLVTSPALIEPVVPAQTIAAGMVVAYYIAAADLATVGYGMWQRFHYSHMHNIEMHAQRIDVTSESRMQSVDCISDTIMATGDMSQHTLWACSALEASSTS